MKKMTQHKITSVIDATLMMIVVFLLIVVVHNIYLIETNNAIKIILLLIVLIMMLMHSFPSRRKYLQVKREQKYEEQNKNDKN